MFETMKILPYARMLISIQSIQRLKKVFPFLLHVMDNRLRADKPPEYFTKLPRPTQPSTFSGREMSSMANVRRRCAVGE